MKKCNAAIVCFLFCLSLISCGKKASGNLHSKSNSFVPKLDTEKEVNLNILGFYANFEALEQVFMDFNEFYPNVNLYYEYTDNNIDATLNRCIAGDNIDIIFSYSLEYDYFYKTMLEKYLVDLNSSDVDLSYVNDNALKATAINGKQQFVPMYYETTGLLVNESLIAQYGLSVPTTLEELEHACDILIENNIRPIYASHSSCGRFFYSHLIMDILNRPDSKEVIASLNKGEGIYDIYSSTLDIFNKWYNKGYFDFSCSLLSDQYNSVILRFFEGDIPFVACVSDTISGCKKREAKSEQFCNNPFNYTYIPSPTGKNGFECVYKPSLLFGLCNVSDSLDYSTEFMRFLFSENGMKEMSSIKGMPSSYEESEDPRIRYFDILNDSEKFYVGIGDLSRRACSQLYSVLGKAYRLRETPEALGEEFVIAMSGYKD